MLDFNDYEFDCTNAENALTFNTLVNQQGYWTKRGKTFTKVIVLSISEKTADRLRRMGRETNLVKEDEEVGIPS